MFCIHCGKENVEGAQFCVQCGKRIEPQSAEPQPQQQTAGTPVPPPAPGQQQSQQQTAYTPEQPQATYQAPYTPEQPQAPQYAPAETTYPMTSQDETLRLINFILCVISCVVVCWAVIPLAWMIPMTVHSWGIYKGTKPNTTAFGVCTLIFIDVIGGILLLVSNKDK